MARSQIALQAFVAARVEAARGHGRLLDQILAKFTLQRGWQVRESAQTIFANFARYVGISESFGIHFRVNRVLLGVDSITEVINLFLLHQALVDNATFLREELWSHQIFPVLRLGDTLALTWVVERVTVLRAVTNLMSWDFAPLAQVVRGHVRVTCREVVVAAATHSISTTTMVTSTLVPVIVAVVGETVVPTSLVTETIEFLATCCGLC